MAFRRPGVPSNSDSKPDRDAAQNLQLDDEDTMASLDLYIETLEEVSGNTNTVTLTATSATVPDA